MRAFFSALFRKYLPYTRKTPSGIGMPCVFPLPPLRKRHTGATRPRIGGPRLSVLCLSTPESSWTKVGVGHFRKGAKRPPAASQVLCLPAHLKVRETTLFTPQLILFDGRAHSSEQHIKDREDDTANHCVKYHGERGIAQDFPFGEIRIAVHQRADRGCTG